jgi:hypothetical protein
MRRWLAPSAALLLAVACSDDNQPLVPAPTPTPIPTVDPAKVVVPGAHVDKGIAAGEIRFVSSDPAPGSTLAGCASGCRLSLNLSVTMLNNWWPNLAHVYGTAGGGCNANVEGVEVPNQAAFGTTIDLIVRGCTTTAALSRLQIFLSDDQDYENAVIQDFGVTYTLQP